MAGVRGSSAVAAVGRRLFRVFLVPVAPPAGSVEGADEEGSDVVVGSVDVGESEPVSDEDVPDGESTATGAATPTGAATGVPDHRPRSRRSPTCCAQARERRAPAREVP